MRSLSKGRIVGASCIAIACVALILYASTSEVDTASVRLEWDDLDLKIVPEDSLDQMEANKPKAHTVLKSLVSLRAYSELAYETAADEKKAHAASFDSGLIDLMVKFAKKAALAREATAEAKKEKDDAEADKRDKRAGENAVDLIADMARDPENVVQGVAKIDDIPLLEPPGAAGKSAPVLLKYNVVMDYAKGVAASKLKFPRGIGNFLISRLNTAVMKGIDPIERFEYNGQLCVGIKYKVVGLEERPSYLTRLGVPHSKYLARLATVEAESAGADVQAASAWLKAGGKDQFKTFLQKEIDITKKRKEAFQQNKVGAALGGIKAAFNAALKRTGDTFLRLKPLAMAGAAEAADVPEPTFRTTTEIKTAAEKVAAKWTKDHKNGNGNGKLDAAIQSKEKVPAQKKTNGL